MADLLKTLIATPRAPRRRPSAHALPTYALYGEPGAEQGGKAVDWLHCESIASRSRQHDWEIRPHRHATLFQILHLREGAAELWVDGAQLAVQGPALLWVPPAVAHGFRFTPDIQGTVLTVLDQHLAHLLAPVPALARVLAAPGLWTVPGEPGAGAGDSEPAAAQAAALLGRGVEALVAEFATHAPWRELALDAALQGLLITLGRLAGQARPLRAPAGVPAVAPEARQDAVLPGVPQVGAGAGSGARARLHVQRLRALVDARFRQQPALSALAAELGITPTQLNRVCHQVLGHSALGVLHARLLLEAQRDLAYTTLSVKQIALGLGFGDAGYFTRFFQRGCGHTPTAWRALTLR